MDQVLPDLQAATEQLPPSVYAEEAGSGHPSILKIENALLAIALCPDTHSHTAFLLIRVDHPLSRWPSGWTTAGA
jgi:hypothetical protein